MRSVERSFARYSTNAVQLDLQFWRRGTLREALSSYRRMRAPFLAEETLRDYAEKDNWLLRVFGESTDLRTITLERLEEVYEREGPRGLGMMGITIKKRFTHLRAAMKYAAGRKIIGRDDVPDLPRIKNDSRPGQRVLGVSQYQEYRMALSGRFKDYGDLAFWTGHRSLDVWTYARGMLDPWYEWKDDDGKVIALGRYLRKSHKTPSEAPIWLPMQVEFQKIAVEMLREPGSPDSLITGHIWGLSKAFAAASDRCGMDRVCPSRDLRRSFASMLAARGYDEIFIRLAMGHAGAPAFSPDGGFIGSRRPTIDDRHYVRATNEMMVRSIKMHSEASAPI